MLHIRYNHNPGPIQAGTNSKVHVDRESKKPANMAFCMVSRVVASKGKSNQEQPQQQAAPTATARLFVGSWQGELAWYKVHTHETRRGYFHEGKHRQHEKETSLGLPI